MKILKLLVAILTMFTILVLSFGYLSENGVIELINNYFDKTPSVLIKNKYEKSISNDFVQFTDNFIANNKQELLNIYYTVISSGMNEFTFYCSNSYEDCNEDIKIINYDDNTLANINNFVSVYNSFDSLKTKFTNYGKVTLYITRTYSEEDIKVLEEKVDKVYNEVVKDNLSTTDNIKNIHNYLINNTVYDSNYTDAIGLFTEGKANCGGYTDAFSLLLDKLDVKNMRISTDNHIWNIVKVDDKWLHVDVTWDDPVNENGKNMLLYNYFLKTTEEFDKTTPSDTVENHLFDKNIYYFVE